jgi:hypothetical protein
MPCHDLFAGRFAAYFETILATRALWLFVHVPKTAGSSLNGELVPILAPSHHLLIDYDMIGRRSYHDMMDAAVDRFIAEAAVRNFNYCTGHILASHTERIAAALPHVRPFTLLREPVARFISDYRYQCSGLHPGNEGFLARYPTIDAYLNARNECNKLAGHLVPRDLQRAGCASTCVDYILSHYDLVGLQEQYALSLRLITTLAGEPRRPTVHKRVRAADPSWTISPATEGAILERNALDVAIYREISGRFYAIAGELDRFLDIVDPIIE